VSTPSEWNTTFILRVMSRQRSSSVPRIVSSSTSSFR
jgi:hypothetical protein